LGKRVGRIDVVHHRQQSAPRRDDERAFVVRFERKRRRILRRYLLNAIGIDRSALTRQKHR